MPVPQSVPRFLACVHNFFVFSLRSATFQLVSVTRKFLLLFFLFKHTTMYASKLTTTYTYAHTSASSRLRHMSLQLAQGAVEVLLRRSRRGAPWSACQAELYLVYISEGFCINYTLGLHPWEMTQNGSKEHALVRKCAQIGSIFSGCIPRV